MTFKVLLLQYYLDKCAEIRKGPIAPIAPIKKLKFICSIAQ